MTVDITDFTVWLIAFLAPTIYLIASRLLSNIVPESVHKENLQQAIDFGIKWATNVLEERGVVVKTKSEIAGQAITYIRESTPDALKAFNIDDERLARMIEARL